MENEYNLNNNEIVSSIIILLKSISIIRQEVSYSCEGKIGEHIWAINTAPGEYARPRNMTTVTE